MSIGHRSMAAVVSAVALLLVGVSPAGAVADPCSFSNDKTNPSIGSIAIEPTSVITGLVKQTLTATVVASDNCGVRSLTLQLNPVGNVTAGSIGLYNFTLVSGTAQAGTWQASTVLTDYLTGGDYEVTEVNVHDVNFGSLAAVYPAANQLMAREATTTTMAASVVRLAAGVSVVLSGRVRVSALSDAAGPLELQTLNATGTWSRLSGLPHDSYGSFSVAIKATRNSQYRAVYAGDGKTAASTSGVVGIQVAPFLTLRASTTGARVGQTVALSGTVRPALAGQVVVLQRLKGKAWVKVSTARLNATSAYRFAVRMNAKGAPAFRVVKLADRERLMGASQVVRLRVG